MRAGKEYEIFIYQKFKELFKEYEVIQNDKIVGKLSGIKREIDVSIKVKVDDYDYLCIVQCKDHNKPADIKIIGEFSSVIKDLGASKGILICTSGFTKTIHQFAKNLGIELITVEDIKSKKWKVEIEIPIVFITKEVEGDIGISLKINKELVEKNKKDLVITPKDIENVSYNNGASSMKIIDYINLIIEKNNIDLLKTNTIEIKDPSLLLFFSEVWVPISITVNFIIGKKYYLKLIRPEEYSQLKNHITKEILPLKFSVDRKHFEFNESFSEINKDDIPYTSTILLEIEENLYPLKQENFQFPGFTLFDLIK